MGPDLLTTFEGAHFPAGESLVSVVGSLRDPGIQPLTPQWGK